MKPPKSALLLGLLGAGAALAPAQASSVRPVMYGPWAMSCPHLMVRGQSAYCHIRFQPAGKAINWSVYLDAGNNSRFTTSGWSRTACRRIEVTQEQGRSYRLSWADVPLERMEDHARRLLAAMHTHIAFFGDCPRENGEPAAYPDTLLDGTEDDFTRAVVATERRLRDPNVRGSVRPGSGDR